MKITLTENAQKELERLNNLYGSEESPEYDNWDKMSELETLIVDAEMYVDEAYIENSFNDLDDLDKWCEDVGPIEYKQSYLDEHPNAVREKIDKMLHLNLIKIY